MPVLPTSLLRPLGATLAAAALALGGAASATAAPASGSPIGNVDHVRLTATGLRVTGWAAEPGSSAAVAVRITVDGESTAARTGVRRADVAAAFPSTGSAQGFVSEIAAGRGTHTVCATAFNAGSGADTDFRCLTLRHPGRSPFGNLDSAVGVTGGIRVTGWADDLDTADAVSLAVTVDGKGTKVSTGSSRPDVALAYPGVPSSTGFGTVVPATPGTHSVCATAVNVSAGTNTTFPCRTMTVPGTVSAPKPAPAPVLPVPVPSNPGPSNTGVPAGTSLTVKQGDVIVTTDSTVIDGWDVRGYVDIRANNVTIRNSVIRGGTPGTTSRGLVTVASSSYSLTIEDSLLDPSTRSPFHDGLRGMNITAKRLDIRGVVDSAHFYGDNVTITDSWLHDNSHFASDPNQGGSASHDDGIQIQRGTGITVRNNTITGATNAAIMLTQDAGQVKDLHVEDNLLDHGACVMNIKDMATAPLNVTITGNTFGRNATFPRCGIKVPATSYALTMRANYFTDGEAVRRTP